MPLRCWPTFPAPSMGLVDVIVFKSFRFLSVFCVSARFTAKASPRFKPHKIISWQLSTNLVTQFYWHPGHPHLEPKAHRGHRNPRDAMPKVPAISDVTHAAPHSHHGDNPVMINTNLPASAQGVKVLWRRGNRGKGLGKADTLSAGGATVISGSEIRRRAWVRVWLCTWDSQAGGKLIPAPPPPPALDSVLST